jgi:hypothetical protein
LRNARNSSNRAVASRMMAAIPVIFPVSSVNGTMVNSTEIRAPSFRTAGTDSLAISVSRLTGLHGGLIAVPMSGAQPLRDDDVERTAERFDLGKTENSRHPAIPEAN